MVINVSVPYNGRLRIPSLILFLVFAFVFWCPYMVINVSVVPYNGRLLPDILLTLYDYIEELF